MLLGFRLGNVEIDLFVVGLVVVEDHFEHPGREGQVRLDETRGTVPVLDAFQVAVGRAHAVALVGLASIHIVGVLCCVFVDDGVALVVVALADEPAEDARRIGWRRTHWIEDAGIVVLSVQRGYVVACDRSPMDLAGCNLGPALDAGEQTLDARSVAMDYVPWRGHVVLESCAVRLENRHQVLGAGQNENVRFFGVLILWQPLVRLPTDGRKGKAPTKAEGAISRA